MAMYGQRSQERIDAFPSADKGTSAGKFQLTRLKMAEMVETTQFRFPPGNALYIFKVFVYIATKARESTYETRKTNAIHLPTVVLFCSVHAMNRQLLLYCSYTLRAVLGTNGHVSQLFLR